MKSVTDEHDMVMEKPDIKKNPRFRSSQTLSRQPDVGCLLGNDFFPLSSSNWVLVGYAWISFGYTILGWIWDQEGLLGQVSIGDTSES